MRTAFIDELTAQARTCPQVFLCVGDLGYSVVEGFAREFPDRFLNAGVAEQNMTGLAAGLASEGLHVFTYSIGNFPTLRCLEQIRNDVAYHGLPVTVVAVGAGTAYGNLGYSHHCVQDLACLRGLPGLRIFSPGDPGEARACVRELVAHPGPSYLRLGKAGEAVVHDVPVTFDAPVPVMVSGAPTAIVATGSVLTEAAAAARLLCAEGTPCDALSFVHITADPGGWEPVLRRYRRLLVVEEHVAAGGLGELLAATLQGAPPVLRACLPDSVLQAVGSQAHLRQRAGLDAASLARRTRDFVRAVPG